MAEQSISKKIINAVLCVLLTVFISNVSVANTDDEVTNKRKEFHIKALFLYNFANFVEWPNAAFKSETSSLDMCLFGDVPFGGFLDAVNGAKIRNRVLNIIRTSDSNAIKNGCHILFVGTDRLDHIGKLFENINHVFVLSIGNVEGFTRQGGIVNILRTQDQHKFEINLNRAIENGLLIDSDVLALARIINE